MDVCILLACVGSLYAQPPRQVRYLSLYIICILQGNRPCLSRAPVLSVNSAHAYGVLSYVRVDMLVKTFSIQHTSINHPMWTPHAGERDKCHGRPPRCKMSSLTALKNTTLHYPILSYTTESNQRIHRLISTLSDGANNPTSCKDRVAS